MAPSRSSRLFSPKHTYRPSDRLTLTLLELNFERNLQSFAAIFNNINRDVLRREGFTHGIPLHSIASQLHEYKTGRTGSEMYSVMKDWPLTKLRDMFGLQFRQIEDTAARISVTIIRKSSIQRPKSSPVSNHSTRTSASSDEQTDTSITTWEANTESSDDEFWNTPSKRINRKSAAAVVRKRPGFLPTMATPVAGGLDQRKRPYYLYRAFEASYGLVARRYRNAKKNQIISRPPGYYSKEFSEMVRPHLNRDDHFASPFMSWAQSPKVAIKHAFEGLKVGIIMAVAIVKYDDLKADSTSRFGLLSGPYLVPKMCDELRLRLPGGYRGREEFLTWATVECTPVAVLDIHSTLMIRAILTTTNRIDLEAGKRLNQFMPKLVETDHLELFIYQLIRRYKVPGYATGRRSHAYTEFVRGAVQREEQLAARPEQRSVDLDLDADSDSDIQMIEMPSVFAKKEWRSDDSE